jgi:hypothetical protein
MDVDATECVAGRTIELAERDESWVIFWQNEEAAMSTPSHGG